MEILLWGPRLTARSRATNAGIPPSLGETHRRRLGPLASAGRYLGGGGIVEQNRRTASTRVRFEQPQLRQLRVQRATADAEQAGRQRAVTGGALQRFHDGFSLGITALIFEARLARQRRHRAARGTQASGAARGPPPRRGLGARGARGGEGPKAPESFGP